MWDEGGIELNHTPGDIFLIWSENKKQFFSQKNHFLFTEQVDSVAEKMC